jgi:tetratricopeptide (TPR) repeat protein
VVREGGGYGGFTDRFIDIRVDDHREPLGELGRLLEIAEVNGLWNLAWTAFTRKQYAEALPLMEKTTAAARRAGSGVLPEVLYDLAVVRAHGGKTDAALESLREAINANPRLAAAAREDADLSPLRDLSGFAQTVGAAESGSPRDRPE